MQPEPVPLAVVATELNTGIRNLEQRHADFIVRDDAGIRCLPRNMVRGLISERDEQVARQREQSRQARANAELPQARQRVRAIQAKQAQDSLQTDDLSMAQSAYLRVTEDYHRERLDEANRRTDEMLSGTAHMHRISHKNEE